MNKIIKIIFVLMLIFLVSCSSQVKKEINETEDSINETSVGSLDEKQDVVKITSKNSDLKPLVMSSRLYPELNEEAKLTFSVKNDGIAKIQNPFSYTIEIIKDGVYVLQKTNNSKIIVLPDDEEVIEKFKYSFKEYGIYKVKLILDTDNVIDELREENNEKVLTIYVKEKSESDDEVNEKINEESNDGCSDTDGGKDFGEVGICTDDNFVNGRKDVCADDERLMEAYCVNSRCNIEIKECEGICKDGKCI